MDMTNEEWKSIYLTLILPKNRDNSQAVDDLESSNDSLDWRTKGAVQKKSRIKHHVDHVGLSLQLQL